MMVGLFEGGKIPERSMVRHICFVVLLASFGSGVVGIKHLQAGDQRKPKQVQRRGGARSKAR